MEEAANQEQHLVKHDSETLCSQGWVRPERFRELDALGEVKTKLGEMLGLWSKRWPNPLTHDSCCCPASFTSRRTESSRTTGCAQPPRPHIFASVWHWQDASPCTALGSNMATIRRWRDCQIKNLMAFVQQLCMERPETNVCRDQRHQSMEHYSFKMKGKFIDVETEALDKCTRRDKVSIIFQHTGTLK